MNITVELAPNHKQGLLLTNPVMSAAGSFGYGLEYEGLVVAERLGAIVTTPTTLRPQRGQPQPRLQELEGGLLIGTGGQNPGIGRVLREYAPRWARGSVPVILNVAGRGPRQFAQVARQLGDVRGVWGVELTLPDRVGSSGAREIVAAVRAETLLPLWAKLPLFRAEELAEVCLKAGANALTVGLPPPGMSIDLQTKGHLLGRLYGRMVKPLALRAVDGVVRCVEAPIIACGGIHTIEDALEFLAVGASAIQVGSATWVEPRTMVRVVGGIEEWMGEREIKDTR